MAGVVAGAQLRKVGIGGIRVIDQAGGFGGTWYWNRYPGVMCDVESYCYMPMLEEMEYIPKKRYAFGEEIREHIEAIAQRFDLVDSALFHTGVQTSEWDEDRSRWVIRTDRGDELRARYLVMAVGILNLMKIPVIPGMETFDGACVSHRPLGLRVHRRFPGRPAHDEARRQGRRDHRDRSERHPGHPAIGRVVEASLRVPAHAGSGRCARQPPDERRLRRRPEPGLAPGAQRELPVGDARSPGRRGSRRRRLVPPLRTHHQPAVRAGHDHGGVHARRRAVRLRRDGAAPAADPGDHHRPGEGRRVDAVLPVQLPTTALPRRVPAVAEPRQRAPSSTARPGSTA